MDGVTGRCDRHGRAVIGVLTLNYITCMIYSWALGPNGEVDLTWGRFQPAILSVYRLCYRLTVLYIGNVGES